MIVKLNKGGGARGLAAYLLADRDNNGDARARADIVGGTLSGRNEHELADELSRLHALRPRLEKHIAHYSVRLPESDRALSDEEWAAIGAHMAEGMGHDAYAVICHGDHIHLLCSRVRLDGSVVSDSHDYRRSEELTRQIEEQWGLKRVEPSHLLEPERAAAHRLAPTAARIALAEQGVTSPAEQVADTIDAVLRGKRVTAAEYVATLELAGITVLPNVASTGRLNGYAYELNGVTVTAKALGRGYTLQNLDKRGHEYVQDRDLAALRECRERRARGVATATTERLEYDAPAGAGASGSIEAGAERDPRSAGECTFSACAGDGEPVRRDATDAARTRAARSASAESRVAGSTGLDSRRAASRGKHAEGGNIRGAAGGTNSPAATVGSAADSALQRPAAVGGGGATSVGAWGTLSAAEGYENLSLDDPLYAEKLLALEARKAKKRAAAEAAATQTQGTSRGRAFAVPGGARGMLTALAGQSDDRTTAQVRAQLNALNCDEYEWQAIPARHRADLRPGPPRSGSAEQLIKSLAWLRRQNALDHEIYVRPRGGRTGLVFVDDLNVEKVARMRSDGLEFTSLVESSPHNLQGWVRVAAAGELTEEETTAIARELAKLYGGDGASADWRHYGRLAGFTNRKPKHKQASGLQPYCSLRVTSVGVSPGGPFLVARVREQLAAAERAKQQQRAHARNAAAFGDDERGLVDATTAFIDARALTRPASVNDESARDFGACLRLAGAGYSDVEIAAALRAASPGLSERHPHDLDRYVSHTVRRAREYQQRQQRGASPRYRR